MGSANSQNPRFSTRVPDPDWNYFSWIVALAAAGLATAALASGRLSASQYSLTLLTIACFRWWLRIASRSRLRLWSAALVILLAPQLLFALLHAPARPVMARSGALVSAVMLYLMFWAYSLLQTRRSLQGVAGMALLLPLTVFVRPAVIIAAIFFSFVFVVACRCRVGGWHAAALLIFTPALLCVGVLSALQWMGIALIKSPNLDLNLHSALSWRLFPLKSIHYDWFIPPLAFAIGIVLVRMLETHSTPLDVIYVSLVILFLAGIACAPLTPSDTALTDICMIIYGGGTALLTTSPPRRVLSRVLVLLLAFFGAALPWLADRLAANS